MKKMLKASIVVLLAIALVCFSGVAAAGGTNGPSPFPGRDDVEYMIDGDDFPSVVDPVIGGADDPVPIPG